MSKTAFLIFIIFVSCFLNSCKKEQNHQFTYQSLSIAPDIKIQNTYWLNDSTGFACGGIKNQKGSIYRTNDYGSTWKQIYVSTSESLYDLCFINDSIGYCCGEKFLLLFSENRGQSWQAFKYPYNPPSAYNVTLRNIYFKNNIMVITGGDNFNKGAAIGFLNNAFLYRFPHADNELRSSCSFNGSTFFMAGYGYLFKSSDTIKTFSPTNISGDFFTGCCSINESIGYACTYNGAIYKTINGGLTWDAIEKGNTLFKKRIHLNSILFLNENNGWCVGDEGLILHTNDGKNWKQVKFNESVNLYSIRQKPSGKIVITSSNGNLYEFDA